MSLLAASAKGSFKIHVPGISFLEFLKFFVGFVVGGVVSCKMATIFLWCFRKFPTLRGVNWIRWTSRRYIFLQKARKCAPSRWHIDRHHSECPNFFRTQIVKLDFFHHSVRGEGVHISMIEISFSFI